MKPPPITALLWLGLSLSASADPLAELPAPWVDRLIAIPAQRLAELEPATVERIRETRERLGGMLAGGETSATDLAPVFGRLGALYAAHRMYAGAELAFHNARALEPDGFRWTYYSAHIALEQGEAEQSLGYLAEAAAIDADYPALALRRGEALLGLNRLDEARAAYAQAQRTPELRAAALYGLGQIDLLQRDWAAAAKRLGEVLALQPQADAARYPLGQALIRSGRRDEARDHLAKRGEVKPDYADPLIEELRSLQVGARFHFENALTAVKRQDYAAAAGHFAAGLDEEPGNARARTSYARALWISGRQDEASAQLERAIALAPAETLPRFLLAIVRDAAGEADGAKAAYMDVLAVDPGHAGALSYLANLSLRQGDYAAAAGHFERAMDSGATEMTLYLHYWGALLRAGAGDEMLRDRLIAFDRRFPEPPVFRYLLARLLATADDPAVRDVDRALTIANALQQAQAQPLHAELMALVLAAAGDFEQAADIQENLVEMARISGAWMHVGRLEQAVEAYRSQQLPEPIWSPGDPMLMPAPVDPGVAMRNYPAGQPY